MARLAYVGGMAVAWCVFVFGCQTEQPTSPQFSAQDFHLGFTSSDNSIIAGEGELYPLAIEAVVTDDSGRATADAVVQLKVISGPGNIAPEWAVSDASGLVRALYYLTVPYGDTTAVLWASAGGEPAEVTLSIRGKPAPALVSFTLDSLTLNHSPGRPILIDLDARVFDRRGQAVSDADVCFKVLNGWAFTGPDCRTDEGGYAQTKLGVHAEWQGTIELVAMVDGGSVVADATARNFWSGWLSAMGWFPELVIGRYEGKRECVTDTLRVEVGFKK